VKGHGEKYDRKKEQAIAALLTAPTMTEAAKICGIGETTLWRWLKTPEFSQRYRQARAHMLESAINRLRRFATDAVTTLHEVATDVESPASSRVAASKAILDTALKAVELEDIESRLSALEGNLDNE
jgi:hypothetical protein